MKKMAAFGYAQVLVLLAIACMVTVCQGQAETIVVGGSENWRFGFNYTDWALKRAPFYINDTLVFRYDPPSNTTPAAHSVYLLPNLWSYLTCDLRWAKLLANSTQGSGDGFAFVLSQWRVYYFASGEGNKLNDCRVGGMKFFAIPLPRRRRA
ncbi:unnamed protein product [Ilex paraguariensis]|uniref:Phytocyanin domain-containing protein n=1 Tax=Ilex paraguariensis TaxID=185542 RepID=A0ABC8UKZ1_9AQUA